MFFSSIPPRAITFSLIMPAIPAEYHSRIVLHEHFELTTGYRLAGIHLNSRNNTLPEGFAGSISRSCHSLQEVQDNKQLDYVFLSPIFQSISKEGYGNGFPMERLREAAASGIINEKVSLWGFRRCKRCIPSLNKWVIIRLSPSKKKGVVITNSFILSFYLCFY